MDTQRLSRGRFVVQVYVGCYEMPQKKLVDTQGLFETNDVQDGGGAGGRGGLQVLDVI